MALALEAAGIPVEVQHHEVGTAGQAEIDIRFGTLLETADRLMLFKYIIKNTALKHGKTVTFMPKPIFQDNGSGMHTHQSLWTDGVPLFYDESGYAQLSDLGRWYIGGLLAHAPALTAFTNPTTNSYRRLVPGYEAPVNLVYSQRNRSAAARIPLYSRSPKAKRVEFRVPDPSCNPYLAFAAMLMAGLDGVRNKIEPAGPLDKDLYELPPEELAEVPQVPGSLDDALAALEADHEFLLEGDVFTQDVIDTWLAYKREHEVDAVRLRPHPWEFHLYYDIPPPPACVLVARPPPPLRSWGGGGVCPPAAGGGGPEPPGPPGGLGEAPLPGHLVDVDSHVLTVLEDAGGLLCRAEDRKHADDLAGIAEGHAEHPDRRVPGQHGQLVEAAAALTPDPTGQRRVSSRFTMPVSSSSRRRAPPTVAVRREQVALLLRRLGSADQRRRRGRRYGRARKRPGRGGPRPGAFASALLGATTPPPTSEGTPATVSALQTHKQTPPTANPGRAAGGCALGLRSQGQHGEGTAQEWRATETVHSQPGGAAAATLWPSWSPVVRPAVPAAAPLANMASVADPAHPVNRGWVPKAHPAIGEPARGAPTNRLRSIAAGHAPASAPGYGPGGTGSYLWGRDRDRTGRAEPARSQGRWPAQWLVGAPGGPWRTDQPIQANYHGGRCLEKRTFGERPGTRRSQRPEGVRASDVNGPGVLPAWRLAGHTPGVAAPQQPGRIFLRQAAPPCGSAYAGQGNARRPTDAVC